MKNVLFAIAFMLMGTFAFASDKAEGNTLINSTELFFINSTDLSVENVIHVTLSCGVEYDIANFTGTTEQLMDMIWAADKVVCGMQSV
jgi:hypothetical protein